MGPKTLVPEKNGVGQTTQQTHDGSVMLNTNFTFSKKNKSS